MIYCIEHAEAAEEIIETIAEAIAIPEAPLFKKVFFFFFGILIVFNSTFLQCLF